jgi:hypothetical protein
MILKLKSLICEEDDYYSEESKAVRSIQLKLDHGEDAVKDIEEFKKKYGRVPAFTYPKKAKRRLNYYRIYNLGLRSMKQAKEWGLKRTKSGNMIFPVYYGDDPAKVRQSIEVLDKELGHGHDVRL